MAPLRAELEGLPFPALTARIDALLATEPAPTAARTATLLGALAALPDHEPLAHALRHLVARDRLGGLGQALTDLLCALPDPGLQRVLRALESTPGPGPAAAAAVVLRAARAALERSPFERLAALALLAAWLERAAPDLAAECRAAAGQRVGAALGPELLRDEDLALLSGAALVALAGRPGFGPRLAAFAGRSLDWLQRAPKSLSQANAEELLARRVYAEPGHFLFELLQNAADAGAGRVCVAIAPDCVRVAHDGQPFALRDVVGVLSIGQSSKRREQIGFFGVGFKSVYGICERPRVHSGLFSFEIADVSMPRRLPPPTTGVPGETLLVLPLRDPADPQRNAEAVARFARQIPPETLLTLPSVTTLELQLLGRTECLQREQAPDPASRGTTAADGPLRLTLTGCGEPRAYQVARRTVRYAGPRERRRATVSPLLVALRLDAQGLPIPQPNSGPRLFAYLPTGEATALRFLVHAHFDLPLDRERLERGSEYNRWLLGEAGALLAAEVARLLADVPEGAARAAWANRLLELLPLPAELDDPLFGELHPALRRGLAGLPLLPGADGEWLGPVAGGPGEVAGPGVAAGAGVWVEPPPLALALAGQPLDTVGRRALAPTLSSRAVEAARALGVPVLGPAQLTEVLGRLLARTAAGTPAPTWLLRRIPLDAGGRTATPPERTVPALGLLLDTLAGQRAAPPALAHLPLLVDQLGRARCGAELALAAPPLRSLYGGERLFVAGELSDEAPAERSALLLALGVRPWGPAELLADLAEPALAARLLAAAGAPALWDYLAQLPPTLLRRAGELPLVPDGRGSLRCLTGPGPRAWLRPATPLGDWLARLAGRPWPLVEARFQARFERVLEDAGARRPELAELARALLEGELQLDLDGALALQRVLDESREELGPGLCRGLAAARIHPDRQGRLRSLVGPDRALRPADAEIAAALDWLPWLHPALVGLGHLPLLAPEPLGAEALARALVGEGEALVDPAVPGQLDAAVAYLGRHAAPISRALAGRLGTSPIWRAAAGSRHRLDALRRPADDPPLAELYAAWGAFAPIAEGPGSPAEFARALGLETLLGGTDLAGLVRDLALAPPPAADVSWRPLLQAQLRRAAQELSRSQLAPLAALPLFADEQGALRPLARQAAEVDPAVCRAEEDWRAALASLGLPLLAAADEVELAPLLDALTIPAFGAGALLDLVRQGHRPADGPGWERLREALSRAAAAGALAPAASGPEARRLLEELPMWPSAAGGLEPAGRLLRGRALDEFLGESLAGLTAVLPATGRLAATAEDAAERLAPLISFAEPARSVLEALAGQLVAGRALTALPAALGDERGLGALLARLRRAGWDGPRLCTLPLGVDVAGRLAALPLLAPDAPTRALLADLGRAETPATEPLRRLGASLASTAWATAAADGLDELLAPLPPRRVLQGLQAAFPTELPLAEHPWLSRAAARQVLYAWLSQAAPGIEADPEARALLARLPLFRTAGGRLRAARDLLLDPSLPDLGLGWELHEEVPEALTSWLRQVFRLDQARLRPVVDALVEGHARALEAGDPERAAQLARVLARALLAGEAPNSEAGPESEEAEAEATATTQALPPLAAALLPQVRRHRLGRRLRLLASDARTVRARELWVPGPELGGLLPWLDPAPLQVAAVYAGPEVQALILAAGARTEPTTEQLEALLAGRGLRPGPGGRTALARYVAHRCTGEPALREALGLARRAWLPDAQGTLRRPAELVWPDEELDALLGPQGGLRPDPELRWGLAPAQARALGFVGAAELQLGTVAAALQAGEPAGETLLRWLDQGLRSGRFSAAELREQLADRLWLADEQGLPRPPGQLLRAAARELFGARRGGWPDAERFSKLAAALKIPPRPGVAELLALGEELARDLALLGEQALLQREPELLCALPACLDRLVALGATPPARWPLIVQAADGSFGLVLAPAPGVFLPEPPELADAVRTGGPELRFPALPDQQTVRTAWLARLGVPELGTVWRLRRVDAGPQLPAGPGWARLERALATLGRFAPELRALPELAPGWRWAPEAWPERLVPVEQLVADGALADHPLRVLLPCAFAPGGGALLVTAPLAADPRPLARLLLRERISSGAPSPALVEAVTDLMQTLDSSGLVSLLRAAQDEAAEQAGRPARPASAPRPALPPRSTRPAPGAPSPPAPAPRPGQAAGEESGLWRRLRRLWRSDQERGDHERPAPAPDPAPSAPQSSSPRSPRSAPPAPEPREARARRRQAPPAGRPPAADADSPPPLDSSGRPPGTPDERSWFSPEEAVRPQLRSAAAWLADRSRPPRFGFVFAPAQLPSPWLYAPRVIGERFERRTQRWLEAGAPASWGQGGGPGPGELVLRGQIPAGEVLLPLPHYARLLAVEATPAPRVLPLPDGRLLLVAPEPLALVCRVALDQAPRFEEGGDEPVPAPPHLLAPTVPDDELPAELHAALAAIQDGRSSPLASALALRDLVRRRYRYDPSYMERPELARWLAELTARRANAHLAALHAGRDDEVLGRGVCYELNVLLCELLRRCGVPCAVASGWVLDGGSLADPDHLWAVALLPTPAGPRWLPLDASSTAQGRPLRVGRRPPGRWQPPSGHGLKPPRPPAWAGQAAPPGPLAGALAASQLPLAELERLARHLEQRSGQPPAEARRLRAHLLEILEDPDRRRALLALLEP